MKAILIFIAVTSSLISFCQSMDNQILLKKINELRTNYFDSIRKKEIKTLIDKLDNINEKLRGYNENVLFMLSNLNTTDPNSLSIKLELMEYVLIKGANPNTLNQTAQLPPLFVIKEEQGFDLLVKYGADVNFRSDYVHIFNKITTYERVKKVMALGFDATINVSYGNLYIHIFLNQMDVETLDYLLSINPGLATQYDDLGWNFTHYASSGKRADLLETLIEHKIDLSLKTTSENEGNYGYDNGIKKGSTVLDIVNQLKADFVSQLGQEKTNELLGKIKASQ